MPAAQFSMTHLTHSPDDIDYRNPVILFDGVCLLCQRWVQLVLQYDTKHFYKLASVQSSSGQALLAHFGYPTDHFDTMLVVEAGCCYEKSEAFFRVITRFPLPWRILLILRFLPLRFRDWLYSRIAHNRYRWFGRSAQCLVPTSDHRARFLLDE